MGGPFWARRHERAWSVPKGELEPGEDELAAALREFREETGLDAPPPPYRDLGEERQRSGKVVRLWATEADLDLSGFSPGTFTMTLRGRSVEVPEIDRIAYVPLEEARTLLVAGPTAARGRPALTRPARRPVGPPHPVLRGVPAAGGGPHPQGLRGR